MASSSFTLDVSPAVLRWARETAGKDITQVAKYLSVSEQFVLAWESGEKPPPWSTLKRLARFYQRPVATLLLPEPPSGSDTPADFRTRQGATRSLSTPTLLAIRTARWLQARAVEMRSELGADATFSVRGIPATSESTAVARKERGRLGITLDRQRSWTNAHEAFRQWKSALAEVGVLVFQFRFPSDEVQGFSLLDTLAPVIVVSEEDIVEARIFTLFHEYAHLLRREPGMCLPKEVSAPLSPDIESFCNRFASSLLVPDSEVANWQLVLGSSSLANDAAIKQIAQRYRVSRDVILIKLRTSGRISESDFNRIYSRWKKARSSVPSPAVKPPAQQRSGPSALQKCTRQRGTTFIELVVQALKRGVITDHDALNYLDVKIKDLNKLERQT